MNKNRVLALMVHFYTATGFLWALLTLLSIVKEDYYVACIWMLVAVIVDSTDGYLARRIHVKEVLPTIDGRRLDDLSDFLNYTFLPVFMIVYAGWVPEPRLVWGILPIVASAFAFCNKGVKGENEGYFLGFPSYWNVFAIYVLVWFTRVGIQWPTLALIILFSITSFLPLRFVYPSQTVKWKGFFVWGGVFWVVGMLVLLFIGEEGPLWLVYLSAFYPLAYLASPVLFLSGDD